MATYSRHLGALYTECTGTNKALCWAGAISNLCLVALATVFLVVTWEAPGANAWLYIPVVLVAIFLGDFMSGVLHWSTDTYFDEITVERIICIAREHHFNPHNIVQYGYRDYVAFGSWASVILVCPLLTASVLLLPKSFGGHLAIVALCTIALCMYFAVHTHRMGHRWSRIPPVRLLQKCRVLHSPEHHAIHHKPPHLIRYCALTGWANGFCDRFRVWRGLEKAIEAATGVPPRKNEREWDVRLEAGLPFLLDPVPSLVELRGQDHNPKEGRGPVDAKALIAITSIGLMFSGMTWAILTHV